MYIIYFHLALFQEGFASTYRETIQEEKPKVEKSEWREYRSDEARDGISSHTGP